MKIAWIHHGDSGGSKRAAFEMVRELSRRGHLIDEFIVRDGTPNLEHFPLTPHVRRTTCFKLAAPRHRVRPYILATWVAVAEELARGSGLRSFFRKLAWDIQKEEYDLVHVDQIAQCLATGVLPFLRIPTIVYSHEASLTRYRGSSGLQRGGFYTALSELGTEVSRGVRDRRDRRNTRWASEALTNSEYSRDVYQQRYRRPASVCPYGVDADTFRPLGLPREDLVLSVGRLVDAKQHHVVIEALGRLPSERRPRLVIATPEWPDRLEDPSYHARLKQASEARQIRLEIVHDPPQEELVRLYNRATAVVFVPRMEPFGLVALEAMACGTPVIGVPEGGVRESVRDGVTGFLVPRDADQIAAKLDILQGQAGVRDRLGADAARYVLEEWTWARTIDRYQTHMDRLLTSKSRLQ